MKGNTFQLSFQYFPSLTYPEFNESRQEHGIRVIKEGTTQTPSKPNHSLATFQEARQN